MKLSEEFDLVRDSLIAVEFGTGKPTPRTTIAAAVVHHVLSFIVGPKGQEILETLRAAEGAVVVVEGVGAVCPTFNDPILLRQEYS